MLPHNVPFVILGAAILWFGWFGFNAGSALASGALASSAFVNTQLGAAAAMLGWMITERLQTGRTTTIGAATGAVPGLATITPAAGYVQPLAALFIGLAAGIVCFQAVNLKDRLGYDGQVALYDASSGQQIAVLDLGSGGLSAPGAAWARGRRQRRGVLSGRAPCGDRG